MKELRHIFTWKFLNVEFFFSAFLSVAASEKTRAAKNMLKVDKKVTSTVTKMLLGCLYN